MSDIMITRCGLLLCITLATLGKDFLISTTALRTKLPPMTSPIDRLNVYLCQTSISPLTIRVTVVNMNEHDVTIIAYGSPLDNRAMSLGLGLLKVVQTTASNPLILDHTRPSRPWPPRRDSLINLGPGARHTSDLVLKESLGLAKESDQKVSVYLQGTWMGVFPRHKDDVSPSDLNHMLSQPGVLTGNFQTKELVLELEKTNV